MSAAAAVVVIVSAAIASFSIPPHRLLRRVRSLPQATGGPAICPVDDVIR